MNIEKKYEKDIAVFLLNGELSIENAADVRGYLSKNILKNNYTKVVISFKNLEYIDSAGIGALVALLAKLRSKGELRFCDIRKSIMQIFKKTSLINFFNIDGSEKESIKKLS